MKTEKPLHVQVAEALGCKVIAGDSWLCGCNPNHDLDVEEHTNLNYHVPHTLNRYDTDWSATGPLIEKHHIQIWYQEDPPELAAIFGALEGPWLATHEACSGPGLGAMTGATPLIAVCNLILGLAKVGKLAA